MRREMAQSQEDGSNPVKLAVFALVILVVVIGFMGTFVTVGAGERGVLLTWGAVEPRVLQPGFNLIMPFAQSVVHVNVQTQKIEHGAAAASKDLQTVSTTVALNYHIDEASVQELYRTVGTGYGINIIDPAIQESVKAATAGYTAEELITKREAVKDNIREHLKTRLLPYHLIVEDISITNFDFSPQFNAQIEAKVTADQRALTEENNLKAIKFQAEQKVVTAQGEADATLAKARAEAEAIRITADALKQNPQLVQLEATKKWNGVLPNYMFGGGAVPFLDLSKVSGATP